jgi:dTDP-4-dehydrorhamnose 3,5-epimerase
LKIKKTIIKDCFVIEPDLFEDARGWFTRVFCDDAFAEIKKDLHFKQINHSYNKKKGTFRGMHYQEPPFAEEKLIRCITGSVIDFILDLRKDSETFLKYIAVELNPKNKTMVFLPKGVAHGFITLDDDTELLYHHTVSYYKDADKGLRFNDPKIDIRLPIEISIISEKDKSYPLLTDNFTGLVI